MSLKDLNRGSIKVSIVASQYTFQDLPSVLRKAFEEQTVYTPTGETASLDSNISLNEALALYGFVRQLQPNVSVEVGLAKGISTLAILQALADNGKGTHHVIDPYQSAYGYVGLEMVHRAGLDAHFVFHETFAENVIPDLPQVQFGFIDASHLFDLTLTEFVLIDKKLSPGGMIGLHDLWMPSVRKVVSYILTNRAYQLVQDNTAAFTIEKQTKQALKNRMKSRILKLFLRWPQAEKIFNAEFLYHLNYDIDRFTVVDNLAIVKKEKEDKRNWQFHQPF
ncbi:MAG: class I SAM-dependent methyltransferase [Leptolyngbyaceae cyanobacterium SM1_3_5]|nr:class I SAM-dependent methyltransferase [Leptolyngbyaceae cyanobacterium SM1_3_5]